MVNFSIRLLPAMLWELWRASRWEMLARFAMIAAVLMLIFSMSRDFGEAHLAVIRGMAIFLAGVGCIFSSSWLGDLDNHKAGFTFRLGYTRPISNFQMVLVPMVYSVANAMLGYVGCALLVQLILGQRLPLLGPALIFGCIVSLSTAVVWSSTHTAEKLLALFLAAGLFVGVFASRHSLRYADTPILLAVGEPDFFDLAWYEYLGLFLTSSLSLVATVFSVGHQRFGEGISWSSWVLRSIRTIATQSWWVAGKAWFVSAIGPGAFRSPAGAQLWFEWRRTIHLLFVAFACSTCVLGFIVLVPLVNETWGGTHAVRMWLGAIAFTPLIYQFLATDAVVGLKHNQGSTRYSLFDATRPLRCDQMIAIKLLVVAGWSLFGLLLMAGLAIAHTMLTDQWSLWDKVNTDLVTGIARVLAGEFKPDTESVVPIIAIDWQSITVGWWLAGLCIFVLLYFSTTALCLTLVFALCRYQKAFTGIVLLTTVNLTVWIWDVSHGSPLGRLWVAYGYLIPMVLILCELVVLRIALKAGYLSKHYLAGITGLWGIYVATVIMLAVKALALAPPIPVQPIAWLFGLAFLLIPLASAAAAPLALASFRHG